jgi:hypothetical protein
VLGAEAALEMLTGRIENAGLGVFLTGPNGSSRRFVHTGRNAGFDAELVAYKNGRQGAVVMIYRNDNEGFLDEVLESVAREYGWPDFVSTAPQLEHDSVPSAVQAAYAGVYAADGRPDMTVVFEDEKLFARTGEDVWLRMYPASETEFFSIDGAVRWEFTRNQAGAAAEVTVRSAGVETRRRRG